MRVWTPSLSNTFSRCVRTVVARDHKPGGDFGVGETLGDKCEHVDLAGREEWRPVAPLPTFADGRKVRAKQREDCAVALVEVTAARGAVEEERADDLRRSRQPDLHLKLDPPRRAGLSL